ncbi:hypothetical protein ECANGB1_1548 [Enterospora canceri]|uniref:Uncharacterized protein n=1 Tax=Enterospora canceri TaxID=1081671 RepID=A0A1Y1S5U5_9MICR|nr:hypothetical protein ECANGB1_1548 [Enterospora canceri]
MNKEISKLKPVRYFRYATGLRSFKIYRGMLYTLSYRGFGLSKMNNSPTIHKMEKHVFTDMFVTDEYVYFTTSHSCYSSTIDSFKLEHICGIDQLSVYTTQSNRLILGNKDGIMVYNGVKQVHDYIFADKYGIVSDIKSQEDDILIGTESGKIVRVSIENRKEDVIISCGKSIIKFVTSGDLIYVLTTDLSGYEIMKITADNKVLGRLKLSEYPFGIVEYRSAILIQFEYSIAFFDDNLEPIGQKTSHIQIKQISIEKDACFIGYSCGLIEQVLLNK